MWGGEQEYEKEAQEALQECVCMRFSLTWCRVPYCPSKGWEHKLESRCSMKVMEPIWTVMVMLWVLLMMRCHTSYLKSTSGINKFKSILKRINMKLHSKLGSFQSASNRWAGVLGPKRTDGWGNMLDNASLLTYESKFKSIF